MGNLTKVFTAAVLAVGVAGMTGCGNDESALKDIRNAAKQEFKNKGFHGVDELYSSTAAPAVVCYELSKNAGGKPTQEGCIYQSGKKQQHVTLRPL